MEQINNYANVTEDVVNTKNATPPPQNIIESDDALDLDDILEKSFSSSEENNLVFNRYKDKKEIAQNIANVFFKYKYRNGGFFNNDLEKSQIGLITQCLGMQIASSISALNLDLSSNDYSKKINKTLNDIFESLNVPKNYRELIFDEKVEALSFNMSPFIEIDDKNNVADLSPEENAQLNDPTERLKFKSCVESASNVLKALAETRDMIGRQIDIGKPLALTFYGESKSSEEMLDILNTVIKYTVEWISSACIKAKTEIIYKIDGEQVYNDERDIVKYIGWNFFKINNQNENYEPSLYMTFSVCSAYMSLANSIGNARNLYSKYEKELSNQSTDGDIEDLIRKKFLTQQHTAQDLRNMELYLSIKNVFKQFQEQCIFSGRYEEMMCKGLINGQPPLDLSSEFIGLNYTKVLFSDIENSTTNDAVINTVYHVLILIYSGLDLDYAQKKKVDEFYDEMQYALQNVLRCYKLLSKKDKSYIIEQYVLSFKEKMPADIASVAKRLRRQRIQVASVLPLLIKAYNEVSRYLVRYPQKQTIEYLSLIMQNRTDSVRKNKIVKEWSWDRDGYNLNSENYYVKAIVDFYDYYENYEKRFIDSDADLQQKLSAYDSKNNQIIDNLKAAQTKELKDIKQKWDEEKSQLIAATHNPLIEQLEIMVRKIIEDNFEELLKTTFNKIICESDEDEESLRRIFNKLVFHTIFENNKQTATNSLNGDNGKLIYTKIKNYCKQNFSAIEKILGEN